MPQLDATLFYDTISQLEIILVIIYIISFLYIVPRIVFKLKFIEKYKKLHKCKTLNLKRFIYDEFCFSIFYENLYFFILNKSIKNTIKTEIIVFLTYLENIQYFYLKKMNINQLHLDCYKLNSKKYLKQSIYMWWLYVNSLDARGYYFLNEFKPLKVFKLYYLKKLKHYCGIK